MQKLARVLETRASLIVAAPGFGKTTLLLEMLEQMNALAVLIPIQAEHQHDAALLCSAVTERLRQHRPGFGRNVLNASRAGFNAAQLGHALAADLSELSEPIVLALDDVHLLSSSDEPTSSGLTVLSEVLRSERLDDVHFILASRTVPPLRFSKLIVEGTAEGLGEEDLAFTIEEVRAYLERISNRAISLSEARSFHDATEGWPAGLALSQVHPVGTRSKPFSQTQVFSYLEEEVMPALPPELRDFATAAAALSDLTPELCDYALARTDSFDCLRGIERRNLFIQRLPGKERVYRLHALFREFLFERYLDPARIRGIQLKAARFWIMKQRWLQAIPYLEAAEAWSELQSLVEEHGKSLVDSGYASTIRQTLDLLAKHGIAYLSPPSAILYAETLVRASDSVSALGVLDGIETDDGVIQAEISILKARIARSSAKHHDTIRIAEEELSKGRCTPPQEGMLHRWAAAGHMFVGQFAEAEAHDLQALERFEAVGNLAEAAYSRSDLGLTYFFRGIDYLKAERYYRQALKTMRRLQRADHLAMVLNNLASLLIVTARNTEALELLIEAQTIADDSGDLYWRANITHSLGETYRALGDQPSALAAFEISTSSAWEAGSTFREQSACLWRAIVLAEMGRAAEVSPLLEMVRPVLVERLRPLDILVDLRQAWLENIDRGHTMMLARRLILVSQELNQERYVRFGRLFLAGVLARADASVGEFMAMVNSLTGNAVQAQDAFTTWPDVAEVVLARMSEQPDHLAHYRSWRALLDRLSADRVFGPKVMAAARRPKEIKVFALQQELAVYIDGQRRIHWRRQAALEALMYLVNHKVGGQDMASALIEAPRAFEDDSSVGVEAADVSKRFHQLLSVLKQVLGRDAIQAATDTWPRRYQLHPDIRVVYDVEQFTAMAESILREPPRPEQLQAIKVARELRAASFAPARGRMHEWTEEVHNRVERLYQQLLAREIEVAKQASLPTSLLEDMLSKSMMDSGVGLAR